MMKNKIILIDFDGVLHKASGGYRDGFIYDEPTEGAVFTTTNLIDNGFEPIIFTARKRTEWPAMRKWLKKYDFPKMDITNIKIPALAYIDDRAVRFTSWKDIVHYFI